MDKVRVLPGVNRPDLVAPSGCETPLRSALAENLLDVAIIGRAVDGEICIWGSQSDADAAIGLLMRGVAQLSAAKQVQDDP